MSNGPKRILQLRINQSVYDFEPGKAPAEMVMLFEANVGPNGVGGIEKVAFRHDENGQTGCYVTFVDGHLEFVSRDRISDLLWTAEQDLKENE